jgi:hypothetical protein
MVETNPLVWYITGYSPKDLVIWLGEYLGTVNDAYFRRHLARVKKLRIVWAFDKDPLLESKLKSPCIVCVAPKRLCLTRQSLDDLLTEILESYQNRYNTEMACNNNEESVKRLQEESVKLKRLQRDVEKVLDECVKNSEEIDLPEGIEREPLN